MSSEESNKTFKQILSQGSAFDQQRELYEAATNEANDIGPDVTDMVWSAARKEALNRLHNDMRKQHGESKENS